MKRQIIRRISTILLFISIPLVFSCDTEKDEAPPLILLNVTLAAPEVPDNAHKLYAVFYPASIWAAATPLFIVSSDTNTIVIPPIDIWDTTFYFEIIFDQTGSGTPVASGNWYQGWYGKINRGADILDVFIVPKVPMMSINITMDTLGTNYQTI